MARDPRTAKATAPDWFCEPRSPQQTSALLEPSLATSTDYLDELQQTQSRKESLELKCPTFQINDTGRVFAVVFFYDFQRLRDPPPNLNRAGASWQSFYSTTFNVYGSPNDRNG